MNDTDYESYTRQVKLGLRAGGGIPTSRRVSDYLVKCARQREEAGYLLAHFASSIKFLLL